MYQQIMDATAKFYLESRPTRESPTVYIEFGILHAGTFNMIAPLFDRAHAVDFDEGVRGFIDFRQGTHFHHMNTTEFHGQIEALVGEKIDVAFIDAGHDFNEALGDFKALLPWMHPNGLIFMHDTYDLPFRGMHPLDKWDAGRAAIEISLIYNDVCEIVTLPGSQGLSIVRVYPPHERPFLPPGEWPTPVSRG